MHYPIDYIVWRIEESEESLLASLQHPEFFADKIAQLKSGSRRKLEVLAVRVALKILCHGVEQHVVYDEDGRPSLAPEGSDCRHLSISHTDGYVAVALADVPVGIDIERRGRRVERVVDHFLKPEEVAVLLLTPDYSLSLHLAWSAKESAFKILGKDYYDLQRLTTVLSIDFSSSKMLLRVEGRQQPWVVHFSLDDDYVFTWIVDDATR